MTNSKKKNFKVMKYISNGFKIISYIFLLTSITYFCLSYFLEVNKIIDGFIYAALSLAIILLRKHFVFIVLLFLSVIWYIFAGNIFNICLNGGIFLLTIIVIIKAKPVIDSYKSEMKKEAISNISYDELIQIIIKNIDDFIAPKIISIFEKYTNNKKLLVFEARIFGLWLISLGVPNEKFKDDVHNAYCKKLNMDAETIEFFYNEISKRYNIYFTRFHNDYKNKGIPTLPSAIYEIIVNKNTNFDPNRFLPLIKAQDVDMLNIQISSLMIAFQENLNKLASENKNLERYFTGK